MKNIILLSFLFNLPIFAQEICQYQDNTGKIIIVENIKRVPAKYKKKVVCFTNQNQLLAKPEDIDLGKAIRSQSISTSLGRMNLRWPRKVESLFGRTPVRALSDAAKTASRYLKIAGFSDAVRNPDINWQVVFMDEDLPESQIPQYLVSNCHPGWMTPPANIYIVAQRVVNGCGDKTYKPGYVADADLARVLLHEIGHSIEFRLLNDRQNPSRGLAEGFASWFEQESADYSSIIPKGSVKEYYFSLAKKSVLANPFDFQFQGSGLDYARASLFFHIIVKRGSIGHLMDVYNYLNQGINFESAVEKRMGWNLKRHYEEANKLVQP